MIAPMGIMRPMGRRFRKTSSVDLLTGLVGHWRFDEGSGTSCTDASGNSLTGTHNGNPAYITGKVGTHALDFDGVDDWVQVADTNLLSFGNGTTDSPFTFAAWVRRAAGGAVHAIFSKTQSTAGSTPFEYQFSLTSADKLSVTLYDNNGGVQRGKLSDNAYAGDVGAWTHYAVTYDGSSTTAGITLYRNGVAIAATATTAGSYVAMENSIGPFRIGNRWPSDATNKGPMNGDIDDPRVYSRVLTSVELAALAAM